MREDVPESHKLNFTIVLISRLMILNRNHSFTQQLHSIKTIRVQICSSDQNSTNSNSKLMKRGQHWCLKYDVKKVHVVHCAWHLEPDMSAIWIMETSPQKNEQTSKHQQYVANSYGNKRNRLHWIMYLINKAQSHNLNWNDNTQLQLSNHNQIKQSDRHRYWQFHTYYPCYGSFWCIPIHPMTHPSSSSQASSLYHPHFHIQLSEHNGWILSWNIHCSRKHRSCFGRKTE